MPRRLIRADTFRLLWIFCFRNHYYIPLSSWEGMCRSRSVCTDCAGWSWTIHYANTIMLVFSRLLKYGINHQLNGGDTCTHRKGWEQGGVDRFGSALSQSPEFRLVCWDPVMLLLLFVLYIFRGMGQLTTSFIDTQCSIPKLIISKGRTSSLYCLW